MKYCTGCGKEIPGDALFCSHCGAKQATEQDAPVQDQVAEEQKPAPEAAPAPAVAVAAEGAVAVATKRRRSRIPVVSLIRNIAILAVAVLMFIGAFMPFSAVSTADSEFEMVTEDMDEMNFTLNTFKAITLFFDSYMELDPEDIEDSDAYQEGEELYEEELEDLDDEDLEVLSPKEKRAFNRLYYLTLRIKMQTERTTPTAKVTAAALLGLLQLCICSALLLLAAFNLLSTFGLFKKTRLGLYRATLSLLVASLAGLLAAFGAFNTLDGGSLSGMAWVCLIASSACIITVTVLRFVFSKRESTGVIVARSLSVALAVTVFCLSFAPMFKVSFRTECDSGKTVSPEYSYSYDFFSDINITEEEYEAFDEIREMTKEQKISYFENYFRAYEYMSKKNVLNDVGKSLNDGMLLTLMGSKLENAFFSYVSLGFLPFLLVGLAALVLLWQNLYFFTSGSYVKPVVLTVRIATPILSAISLAMSIVMTTALSPLASVYLPASYGISIGAGVICLVIFAIIAALIPGRLTPKEKKKPRPVVEAESIEEQF